MIDKRGPAVQFYENPPNYFEQKDDDVDVLDLGVPGYALGMFAPGRTPVTWMEEIALTYGALKWARRWKDVGWLPKVKFSATWTNPHLPGGHSETTGSLGIEQVPDKVPVRIGRVTSNASTSVRPYATSKKRRVRRSTNNTNVGLPSDPWHFASGVDVTMFDFRGQYFAARDMVEAAMDCYMKFLFEVSFHSLDATERGKGIPDWIFLTHL